MPLVSIYNEKVEGAIVNEEHQRVAVGWSHTDPAKGCGWARVIIFGQEY
jgi:hypothetical protein